MAVSRGRKRKAGKPIQHKDQSTHSFQAAHDSVVAAKFGATLAATLHKTLLWSWKHVQGILIWAGVAVTLAGVLSLLPRVAIEPSGPYDPSNPSAITFTLANINIIPLRNVQALIGICHVSMVARPITLKGGGECNGPQGSLLTNEKWRIRWLDVDERWQIALEEVITTGTAKQIEDANITIAVEYTPWWMPPFWRNKKQFRFVTTKRSDGKIYWVPTPLTH
jgi:hypothetical protein